MEKKQDLGKHHTEPIKAAIPLLVLNTFFVGAFLSSFEIGASTLYLSFISASHLPLTLVMAGCMALLVVILFHRYLSQKHCKGLLLHLLFFALPLVSYFLILLTSNVFCIHLVYMFFLMINLSLPLLMSRCYKAILAYRHTPHFLHKNTLSFLSGGILAGAVVLLLKPSTNSLFLLSSLFGLLSFLLQSYVYKLDTGKVNFETHEKFLKIADLKDKHNEGVGLAFLFLGLSVFSSVNVFCYYLSVGQQFYSADSSIDQGALQFFFSSMVVATAVMVVLFKILVPSRFFRNYSLLVLLVATPVVLSLLCLLCFALSITALNVPSFYILLFVSSLITQVVLYTMKSEIEAPAFQSFYYSFDRKLRKRLEVNIEFFYSHILFIASGVLVFLFTYLASLFVVPFFVSMGVQLLACSYWIYVVVRLFRSYKGSLKKMLQQMETSSLNMHTATDQLANESLIHRLHQYRKTNAYLFQDLLLVCLKSESLAERLVALAYVKDLYFIRFHQEVADIASSHADDQSGLNARELMAEFAQDLSFHFNVEHCLALGQSSRSAQRQRLASILAIRYDQAYFPYIQLLLRDSSADVLHSVLFTVIHLKLADVEYSLVELLQSACYSDAYSALGAIGSLNIEPLVVAFHKPRTGLLPKACMIKLISKQDSLEARQFIFSKLNIQDAYLRQTIYNQLLELRWAIDEERRWQIHEQLKAVFENLAISKALHYNALTEGLKGPILLALERETKTNHDNVFLLLSILYEPKTISSLRALIDSKAELNYLLGLIDLITNDREKALLLPFVENRTAEELNTFILETYSVEKMKAIDLLDYILMRDINSTSRWTKVCAMQNYPLLAEKSATDALVSHLFNSDELLQETAARVLFDIDRSRYHTVMLRLKPSVKEMIEAKILKEAFQQRTNIYDRASFLFEVDNFRTCSFDRISRIAEEVSVRNFAEKEIIYRGGVDSMNDVLIVVSGRISSLTTGSGRTQHWSPREVLIPSLLDQVFYADIQITAENDALVYLLPLAKFDLYLFEKSIVF